MHRAESDQDSLIIPRESRGTFRACERGIINQPGSLSPSHVTHRDCFPAWPSKLGPAALRKGVVSSLVPVGDPTVSIVDPPLEVHVVSAAALIEKKDFELNHSYFREPKSSFLAHRAIFLGLDFAGIVGRSRFFTATAHSFFGNVTSHSVVSLRHARANVDIYAGKSRIFSNIIRILTFWMLNWHHTSEKDGEGGPQNRRGS